MVLRNATCPSLYPQIQAIGRCKNFEPAILKQSSEYGKATCSLMSLAATSKLAR